MNKNMKIFKTIDSQVKNTSVVSYIKNTSFKKEHNCEECVPGSNPDCYFCLLTDGRSRSELDNVISKNSSKNIYNNILSKNKDEVSKRISDIVESAMYLKLL